MLRPRIRTVLLGANIVLLLLPLTGVWILHLYESALIRQTESELMAQAALLAASYRSAWLAAGGIANAELPQAQPITTDPYFPGQRAFPPLIAVLDLSDDPVLPPPDEATPAIGTVEPFAKTAGEQLQPVLREAQALTLAAVRLVDHQGIVVASTAGELGLSLGKQYEIVAALSGAAVSTLRARTWKEKRPALDSISRTSDLRVFVALPALAADSAGGERALGAVILSRTPRSISQALYAKRVPLAFMLLVLLGGGAFIAWLTARLIAQPIAIVTREARRVAAGENTLMAPLARPMTREVAELSASLVTMAATLERRAEYIGGFATAVSHEFKTPLTAMNGTIELLTDHLETMSAAERQRFFGNLRADVDRLGKLVRRLLDLARADTRRRSGAERTDLAELLPALAERYRGDGLAVAIAGEPAPVIAAIDPATLETALSNLLDNIRQHGGPQATARLSWARAQGRAVIRLADDGPGISPGNAARIFDPFFTTARDRGGTGLGLAIVRSLLGAFDGSIALVPAERGALFEVALPLAAGA